MLGLAEAVVYPAEVSNSADVLSSVRSLAGLFFSFFFLPYDARMLGEDSQGL